MEAYDKILPTIKSIPEAKFAPLIHQVAMAAKTSKSVYDHFILVILTKGKISDEAETFQVSTGNYFVFAICSLHRLEVQ